MAKKLKDPTVMIPHFDSDGERCWSTFRFAGTVDKRTVKRAIRSAFKTSGAKVHTRFIYEVMRRYMMSGPVVIASSREAIAPQD